MSRTLAHSSDFTPVGNPDPETIVVEVYWRGKFVRTMIAPVEADDVRFNTAAKATREMLRHLELFTDMKPIKLERSTGRLSRPVAPKTLLEESEAGNE